MVTNLSKNSVSFSNLTKNSASAGNLSKSSLTNELLLMEDGSFLLLESVDGIVLEGSQVQGLRFTNLTKNSA